MPSPAITTICLQQRCANVTMVESLPDDLQERVADGIREYIAELEEENRFRVSFKRTPDKLAEAARQAREDIAAGKSSPMDYDRL